MLGVGDGGREGGRDTGPCCGDELVDGVVLCRLVTELFDAWSDVLDSLAFRRLLADCLMDSFQREVALAHNFDLARCSFSESILCWGPFFFISFFSKSFCSSCFRRRRHSRKKIKAAMSAASKRESERMRIVRAALSSYVLDQPGGSNSVSLGCDIAGVDARSSMGRVPAVLEAS